MTHADKILSYIWLIQFLHTHPHSSREQINRAYNRAHIDTQQFDRQRFLAYRDGIYNLFSIDIQWQRTSNHDALYFIANPEVFLDHSFEHWIISTLSTTFSLQQYPTLHNYVLMEDQPSGNFQIPAVLDAMLHHRQISFTYNHSYQKQGEGCTVAPWALRYFETRWYLLGVSVDDHKAMYSLDRMSDIQVQPETFRRTRGFSADAFFAEYYGVFINTDLPACTITFRAFDNDVPRFLSNPIHGSQTLVRQGEAWADFTIFCHPTNDLLGRFASRTFNLQILSPEPVVIRFRDMLRLTLEHYGWTVVSKKK